MKKNLFINSVVIITVALLSSSTLVAQVSSSTWSLAGNNNATSSSKLGTSNLVPLKFFTNNSQRMVVDSLGKVGIGITKPVNIFTVKSGGGTPVSSWLTGLNSPIFMGFAESVSSEHVLATASNTPTSRSVFHGRRSRGTLAAPAVVANNDYLTSLLASGYDGSTYQNPAGISIFVDGVPSAGNVPARISLVTGSNLGNRMERLKVGSTGNFNFNNNQLFIQQSTGSIGVGTTTPNASSLLEINSTTKGILTSRMTQAQRDAIASPATGLLIYQTNNTPGFYYYAGSAWTPVKSSGSTGSGWSLTGNAGTNASVNFVGTIDAEPLIFRVNNIKAGFIDNSTYNTGTRNTAFGQIALYSNTTGIENTANGYGALYSNQTGNDNAAYGKYALFSNNGDYNTALGFNAMFFNTTGMHNTATGSVALQNNTTSNNNTANGYAALYSNNGGNENTAVGTSSLYTNISGNDNTATGFAALNNNTSGNNTATGAYALYANTTGYSNVGIGIATLYNNTIDRNQVAIGDSALFNCGIGGPIIDVSAGNTAIGSKSLYSNTTGYFNTAIGYQSLYSNIDGGGYSTATGYQALYSNNASFNTGTGYKCLYTNSNGLDNTANGAYALIGNQSGSGNTAMGFYALRSNTTGGFNTAIGESADAVSAGLQGNLTNATAIGAGAIADQSNRVRIGNNSVSSIGGVAGWSNFSDGRYKENIKKDVQGLAFINRLQPITYTIDINGLNDYYHKTGRPDSSYEKTKAFMKESVEKASKIIYNGFIAQDVEKAAEKLSYNFSGVDKPQTKDGLYGLRYADFVVPLVKAVQELSKMNDDKDAKIDALQKQNNDLESRLEVIETLLKIKTSSVSLTGASLDQNIPNPFQKTTTIGYIVPKDLSGAQIIITDKSGKILKKVNIPGGKGTINVDATILSSGAYNYSLFVNGKLAGTKQMERLK